MASLLERSFACSILWAPNITATATTDSRDHDRGGILRSRRWMPQAIRAKSPLLSSDLRSSVPAFESLDEGGEMLLKAGGAYLGVPTKSGQRRGGSASGALTSPPLSRRIISAAPFVVYISFVKTRTPPKESRQRGVSGTLMGPTILGEPSLSVRAPLDGNVRHKHNSRGAP
jgi:hypothetical protein